MDKSVSWKEVNSLTFRDKPILIMHYGEIFKIREIAVANEENAEDLGIGVGEPYLVIN